jgi:2-aminoethylphosphonate-pyruvate transaminase
VDAMSSFGGVEMDMKEMQIDFLVSSSNKCIEGGPGAYELNVINNSFMVV